MKLFFSIAAVIIVVLIGVGVWLLFFNNPILTQPGSTGGNQFPTGTSTGGNGGSATQTPLQNDPDTQAALQEQLANPQYSYYGTVVVMPYALQNWGDENAGNQALLKYDSATGWTVVSQGGGAWDVPSLESQGVPAAIAEQLIAGEN